MLDKTYATVLTARVVPVDGGIAVEPSPKRQEHPTSRATRFVDDSTRFLFLSISDKLKLSDKDLRLYLSQWMRDGLLLRDEHYTFLGFTDGHVKEGKLVFFREDASWSVARFMDYIGNLRDVYSAYGYGKYAARLALSFSSTVESLDVPFVKAARIPDRRARDGSLHSDGCGLIRHSFAMDVCRNNGIAPDTCVFQIRRGGIKGLLVRYPDNQFDKVTLRMAIRRAIFEKMLQDQLDLIGCILHNRDQAEKYIKGELDASNTTAFNQDLYAILLAKHDLNEPYVEWKLRQFQQQQCNLLHKKLNLRVEDSCYVFGVIDESGVLEEDEVFLNLPGRTGVLTRDVIVGRDLDGDEYFVTWEPGLIPRDMPEPQHRAGTPTANTKPPRRLTEDAMNDAALDTFIRHKYNKTLRFAAKKWLDVADATPHLANYPYAQELAPIIESALDCIKSGADPADIDKRVEGLKRRFREPSKEYGGHVSPLKILRERIPHGKAIQMSSFDCDSSLILHEDPEQWEDDVREAAEAMKAFNRSLSVAIKHDEEIGDSDSNPINFRDRPPRQANRVTQEYQERYFGGGSFVECARQRKRASAWYCYGYSQKKRAFAWLGERYLNEIRAHYTNHGRPVLYVGASVPPGGKAPPFSPEVVAVPSMTRTTTQEEALSPVGLSVYEELRSVELNPRPSHPVASQPTQCVDMGEHAWRVSANGTTRSYVCQKCRACAKERKVGRFWEVDTGRSRKGIGQETLTASASSASVGAVSRGTNQHSDMGDGDTSSLHSDGTFVDALDIPPGASRVSLPRDEPLPSSSDTVRGSVTAMSPGESTTIAGPQSVLSPLLNLSWLSGFTTRSRAPSAASSTPSHPRTGPTSHSRDPVGHVVRLPRSLIASPPAVRTLPAATSMSPVAEAPEPSTHISTNTKPQSPVGEGRKQPCSLGAGKHAWGISAANGTSRQYVTHRYVTMNGGWVEDMHLNREYTLRISKNREMKINANPWRRNVAKDIDGFV
ncbi:predicted protein [Postia placenta Mad-698-R]|nr:predicted protein [Postia placenta Mad-698-R]